MKSFSVCLPNLAQSKEGSNMQQLQSRCIPALVVEANFLFELCFLTERVNECLKAFLRFHHIGRPHKCHLSSRARVVVGRGVNTTDGAPEFVSSRAVETTTSFQKGCSKHLTAPDFVSTPSPKILAWGGGGAGEGAEHQPWHQILFLLP